MVLNILKEKILDMIQKRGMLLLCLLQAMKGGEIKDWITEKIVIFCLFWTFKIYGGHYYVIYLNRV